MLTGDQTRARMARFVYTPPRDVRLLGLRSEPHFRPGDASGCNDVDRPYSNGETEWAVARRIKTRMMQ